MMASLHFQRQSPIALISQMNADNHCHPREVAYDRGVGGRGQVFVVVCAICATSEISCLSVSQRSGPSRNGRMKFDSDPNY
jgi:hypothetical protein